MAANNEREQRKLYNEAAVKAAGEYHAHRYQGLITGAELPPALAAGGRIGMIGVADEIRERIPRNKQYAPRTLVPMVDGKDVKLPGEDRVLGKYRGGEAQPRVKKLSRTPDLNSLL